MNGLCKSSVKLGDSKPRALVPASPLDGALAETLRGSLELSKQCELEIYEYRSGIGQNIKASSAL